MGAVAHEPSTIPPESASCLLRFNHDLCALRAVPSTWDRSGGTAGLDQDSIREAPAVLVVTAVPSRSAAKHGGRVARYIEPEAGHYAQNVLLQATALDLGAVPIGAFGGAEVATVLHLPADHELLCLIPVGHPRTN
jgi:nitroreductase